MIFFLPFDLAGTAGFTLASRLSESGATVAVIEAGFDEQFSLINGALSATPGGDVVGVGSDNGDNLNSEPSFLCQLKSLIISIKLIHFVTFLYSFNRWH